VIGGNLPPLEERIPLEFKEALLAERPDFLTLVDNAIGKVDPDPENPADLGAVARVVVTNDEQLGKAGNLVKIIRAAIQHVEGVHVAVKAPYLLGGRLVDAEKNALFGRLSAAKVKVEGIANVYLAKKAADEKAERDRIEAEQRAAAALAAQAERDRVAAEQAAAKAVEEATNKEERDAALDRAAEAREIAAQATAAAALAPAATMKSEPVRSDEGAAVSASTDWDCRVDDYPKAFKAVKDDPKVREAIDAAIKRKVKATKGVSEIPGVTKWPVTKGRFS
jgi:hypothetical protein